MKLRLPLTAAIIAASAGSIFAAEAASCFYASVYSCNFWKEYPSYSEVGIYSFDLDYPDSRLVKADDDLDASGGGTMTEDFYFCTKEMAGYGFVDVTHFTFKPDTWEYNSQIYGAQEGVATDLAYDHTSSKIYGCFTTDPDKGEAAGGYVFGTINEATGERLAIHDITTPWIALGCTRNGDLYAVDMAGKLLSVDKITGATEELASLGFSANRRSTGAIDTATGIFYVVVTNEDESTIDEYGYSVSTSKLYAVDIEAKQATLMYEFEDGEAIGGMYIPGPLASDDAPAAPSDMSLRFDDGDLNGSISFTMPSATFGGGTLEGEVSYLIRANGSLFAQGTATAGATVNATGKVDEDGQYEFVLELSNAAGRGPKATTSLWIGHDTPEKIANATLTYANGLFTLTWEQPATTQHGGYMDTSLISYTVTRNNDDYIVASNTTSTTVDDAVAMPEQLTSYSYSIDLYYRGKYVSTYTTEDYKLGAVTLPYTVDFDDPDCFSNLTVIDANGDRAEWYYEEYWYIEALDLECTAALYPYSSTNKADDWLILPAIKFEKDTKYAVEFQVSTSSDSYTERLAVSYGTAPTAEAMTNTILEAKEYAIYEPVEENVIFSPAETGFYNIGFYACSDANGSGLALRNIKVSVVKESAVESIANGDDNTVVEVYNLQGVRVNDNARGGLYIEVKADGTARKVIR
ncbi:MAG: choice-of-anchor J domain-containing protein [Bacteroidales bacterium]|nr:choice-of-anchor J domain-containing protein [Bacteroidales bacterium]